MNKFFNNKNLAFTLAEMMVILTLFSVISAATLPVITARNNIDMSEDSTASGYFPDPWKESNNGTLSYYNTGSPFANKSAVIIGGKVSDDAYSLGYPQLIIKDNNVGNTLAQTNQIILMKRNGSNAYLGGRIALSSPDYTGEDQAGCIALGYEALYARSTGSGRRNLIAIGDYAGYQRTGSAPYMGDKKDSILIGNRPNNYAATVGSIYINRMYGSTVIGNYSGAAGVYNSVKLGNYAGLEATSHGSVDIGNYASYATGNSLLSVAAGTYAGSRLPSSVGNVNLGFFSGYGYNARSSVYSVNVGSYAGAYTNLSAGDGSGAPYTKMIAIGKYAAANIRNTKTASESIYIGSHAGRNSATAMYDSSANYPLYSTIMIGSYAGFYATNPSTDNSHFKYISPILIGYYAGSSPDRYYHATWGSGTPVYYHTLPVAIGSYALNSPISILGIRSELPAVSIGAYAGLGIIGGAPQSVFIGHYAGVYSINGNTVCIGFNACYSSVGSNDVRIAPYNPRTWFTYTSATGSLRSNTSYIGYANALGTMYSEIAAYLTNYILFYSDASNTSSNMVLSPLSPDTNGSDEDNSFILLYAENVYGPYGNMLNWSDRRLKENIRPLKYGLKDVRKINIYEFKWKDKNLDKPQIGVIAQEFQKVIPEGVYKMPDGYLTIGSDWILFSMLNAIQELDKSLISIQNSFKSYLKEYVSLVSRVKVLEKEVKTLEKENKTLIRDIDIAYRKAKKLEVRQ